MDVREKIHTDWVQALNQQRNSFLFKAAGRRCIPRMPRSVHLDILPVMISPLKGRKTMRRNSTIPSVQSAYHTLFSQCFKVPNTIDIDEAITMADEAIRNLDKIVHADA